MTIKKNVFVVRGIPVELKQKLKQQAAAKNISIGQALSAAIKEWLDRESEKTMDFKNITKIKGIIKGGKKESWSREIDKILYG